MRHAVRLFLVAFFTALLLRFVVLEVFRVVSVSMTPTLIPGDLLFATKFDYALRLPFSNYEMYVLRRPVPGELVAFEMPERGLETYLKRVVAVSGDIIEFRDGKLLLNGVAATYEASPDGPWEKLPGAAAGYRITALPENSFRFGPVAVPKDHFFVLGDNRTQSIDSRDWGPIPYAYLRGRPKWIGVSVDENGHFRGDRWLRRVR